MRRNDRYAPSIHLTALSLVPLSLAALPAGAAEPTPSDRFQLELGTFVVSTDTTVQVDGNSSSGTHFDAEEKLGFDDVNRFRAEAAWRFAQRHRLRTMYFRNARSSTHSLDEDITFNDTTFPLGVDVHSENTSTIFELTYEYAFMQRDGWELAGSFGLHQTSFDLKMSADVDVDGTSGTISLIEDADVSAPLPLIGLRGTWQLGENWLLNAQVQYFQLKYDVYDGSIADYKIDLTWMFTKHFGIGLGYNQFVFRFDLDADRFNGTLRWKYAGGLLSLKATW